MIKPSSTFAVAQTFTPIFNTQDLRTTFGGGDGKTLPLQNKLLKELEMIAFPSTCFTLLKKCPGTHLVEVQTNEYPASGPLFVDERFLLYQTAKPNERQKKLPQLSSILETMVSFLGAPYLWGGNCLEVPEIMNFYPPKVEWDSLDETSQHTWKLHGMDCSGLIYFATDGFTPRNTSSLIHYGKSVAIEGKKVKDWNLLAGDLIVWKGHVIVVLDSTTVIESLGGKGVIITPLTERIEQIQTQLQREPLDHWESNPTIPENERFVVRRWYQLFF